MNLLQNEPSPMPINPFFQRGPIRDPSYFFGRVEETTETLQMLSKDQCVSIVGPRKIGKTSLLFHLFDSDMQKRHGLGEEYLPVYVDCQSMGDLDKPQSYQWLWQEARRALAERGGVGDWADSISGFREFREAVMETRNLKKECKPVFLLDEFDAIATNERLDRGFFDNLRSLVPTAATYVTSSQDSLFDLTYVGKGIRSSPSPLFDIFEQIHLGFLKPREAEEMILGLLAIAERKGLFAKKDLAFVFEIAGYHPFFLQLACYHLFEQKAEYGELAEENYETVRQQYAEDTERFFRYSWDHLKEDERKSIRLVCKGKLGQLSDRQRLRLERKCILYNNAIFSSVFVEFVRRHDSDGRLEESARTTLRKQLVKQSAATVRASALLAVCGLVIGWFATQVSSPVALFFAGGLLLVALLVLVIGWTGGAQ